MRRRNSLVGLLAVLPALAVVLGFATYPILFAAYISFTRTNGIRFEWRWFDNYIQLLNDPIVALVFVNNLKFLISVPLVIFFALLVSVLLFERVRGWRFFRVIFFLPNVLSVAVIGIMFRNAFGYYGPVNQLIAVFGGEPVQFFTDGTLAISIIVIALVWSGFGFQSLLLLSGLTAINPSVFEAAALDGAGWWKRLWYITVPEHPQDPRVRVHHQRAVHVHVAVRLRVRHDRGRPRIRHDDHRLPRLPARLLEQQPGIRRGARDDAVRVHRFVTVLQARVFRIQEGD